MIYGASGYTGELIAELARTKGLSPVLAGRSQAKVRPLAEKLGFRWREFGLDKPGLEGMKLVLHCAGPFSQTSRQMVDACLAAKAHYLDVTGEIDVFEAVLSRDAEARQSGIVLLPGTGFDVVPSDCLAAKLKAKLPTATSLELAFAVRGRSSPGTLKTALENMPKGGLVRRGGKLQRVPAAFLTKEVRFADKPRTVMSIPWGDIATAWKSTGIPDITTYVSARPAAIRAAKLSRFTAPLLALAPVQSFLRRRIEQRKGPDAEERAKGSAQFWGRVSDGSRSEEMTLTIVEGYTFTAVAAVECAQRVLAGVVKPGAWTPSLAFGADFIDQLPAEVRK